MIFIIAGSLVFVTGAWIWRRKLSDKRIHGFLAVLYSAVTWFCSWWLGIWILLDVLKSGSLGITMGTGIWYSLVPAGISYWLLRKKEGDEKSAKPVTKNESNYTKNRLSERDQSIPDTQYKSIPYSKKRKIVIWSGIGILVLMFLFPPWRMKIYDESMASVYKNLGIEYSGKEEISYRFLLANPEGSYIDSTATNSFDKDNELQPVNEWEYSNYKVTWSGEINFVLLFVQILITTGLAIGLVQHFKRNKNA